ncbi:MBL fold metallo-hydrolase [Candidatus Uhrbacteria bacterium]|nr:MBL fold metallo-hydrolase [Candidatus Uhrbacteria bacterium]
MSIQFTPLENAPWLASRSSGSLRARSSMHHANSLTGFTLLGTGPASPIPRIYCFCATCADARKAGSKSRRRRSSALLSIPKGHILFDASPDVLEQLERANTTLVDALFFTHAHADATGGFFDLKDVLYRQKYPATLYVETGTWEKIARDVPKEEVWFKIKFITPGKLINVLGVSIMPFRVLHSAQPDFPTLGYRIGDKLVYASDVKEVPDVSEQFIAGAENAVLDGCMWFDGKIPTHFTVSETIKLASRLKVKNLYLTQISHAYPPYVDAVRQIGTFCKKNKITTRVSLAYDGMTMSIE